jgi:16S rRNA (cytosine1402-N4)-methyltransferase
VTAPAVRHVPVLLDEVIDALAIAPGERHVDATFGAGGYTQAMLGKGANVIAFDRDPDAIAAGASLVAAADGRLTLVQGVFSSLDAELARRDALPVDDGYRRLFDAAR